MGFRAEGPTVAQASEVAAALGTSLESLLQMLLTGLAD